jgi:hypothetical protein
LLSRAVLILELAMYPSVIEHRPSYFISAISSAGIPFA